MKTLSLDASAPSPCAEPRRSSCSADRAQFDGVLREVAHGEDEGAPAGAGTDDAAASLPGSPTDAVACGGASGAGASAALLAIACGGVPLATLPQVAKLGDGAGSGRGGAAASGLASGALAAPGAVLANAEGVCPRDGTPAGGEAAPPSGAPVGAEGATAASRDGREGAERGDDGGTQPRRSRGAEADLAAEGTVPGLEPAARPPDATPGASVLGAPPSQRRDPGDAELAKASAPVPLLPPDARSADGAVLRNAAHLRVETPGLGALELHLRVRDGVAHVRLDGEAARAVEARAAELSRALASEGLKLGQLDARQPTAATAWSSADAGSRQQRDSAGREHHVPAPAAPPRAPTAAAASRTSSGRYTVRA